MSQNTGFRSVKQQRSNLTSFSFPPMLSLASNQKQATRCMAVHNGLPVDGQTGILKRTREQNQRCALQEANVHMMEVWIPMAKCWNENEGTSQASRHRATLDDAMEAKGQVPGLDTGRQDTLLSIISNPLFWGPNFSHCVMCVVCSTLFAFR